MDSTARPGLATALVAAPILWLAAEAFSPTLKADTGAQLTVIAAHPDRWYTYTLLLLLGSVAFIPGIVGIARLTRSASTRITNLALALLGWSMVIACTDVTNQFTAWKAVGPGVDRSQMSQLFARLDDAAGVGVLYATGGLSFLIGSVLLSIALARTRSVPTWSAVGFGTAMVLQIVGFSANSIPVIALSAVIALIVSLPLAKLLTTQADTSVPELQRV